MVTLIPLFWTSGDVYSQFQSQSGQPYSCLAVTYMLHVPWDSPLVQHLPTSICCTADELSTDWAWLGCTWQFSIYHIKVLFHIWHWRKPNLLVGLIDIVNVRKYNYYTFLLFRMYQVCSCFPEYLTFFTWTSTNLGVWIGMKKYHAQTP